MEEAKSGLKKGYNIYMIFNRFNLFFNLQTSDYAKKDNSIHKINQKLIELISSLSWSPMKNEPKKKFRAPKISAVLYILNWILALEATRNLTQIEFWIQFSQNFRKFSRWKVTKKRIKSHSCQIMADNRIQFLQIWWLRKKSISVESLKTTFLNSLKKVIFNQLDHRLSVNSLNFSRDDKFIAFFIQ